MNLHTEYYVTVHIIVSLVAFYHLNILLMVHVTTLQRSINTRNSTEISRISLFSVFQIES